MICTSCGAYNADASGACSQCGAPLSVPGATPGVQPPAPPAPPMPPGGAPAVPVPPTPPAGTSPGTLPVPPPWQPAQPLKSPKRRGLIIGIVAAAVIVIGAIAAGAVIVFGGSSSPGTVAQDMFNSAINGKFSSVCNYALPSEKKACTSSLSSAFTAHSHSQVHLSGHMSVGKTQIQGNEALVTLVGKLCISASGAASPTGKPITRCKSNSNPSLGMPSGPNGFQSVYSSAVGSSSDTFTIPLEKLNGRWYVNFSTGSG